jgi:hypothetical protein
MFYAGIVSGLIRGLFEPGALWLPVEREIVMTHTRYIRMVEDISLGRRKVPRAAHLLWALLSALLRTWDSNKETLCLAASGPVG